MHALDGESYMLSAGRVEHQTAALANNNIVVTWKPESFHWELTIDTLVACHWGARGIA